MRIFIAGAGGTLGLPLLKRLVRDGHTVTGMTRTPGKGQLLEAAGARAVIADALNAEEMARAVREAQPTHVVNLLTALPASIKRAADLQPTNLLRTVGAENLLRASLDAGVQRLVAESFVSVVGYPEQRRKRTEEDPMGPVPQGDENRAAILAMRSLEERHFEARWQGNIEAVVLRYGLFYGAGVPSTEYMVEGLRRRKVFMPRHTRGIASWIEINDAVSATVAALEHPDPSVLYNIADDEPVSLDSAIAYLTRALGVPGPRSVPVWLARWTAPAFLNMLSANLALDNRKAKKELGWKPAYPSLASGFASLARTMEKAA